MYFIASVPRDRESGGVSRRIPLLFGVFGFRVFRVLGFRVRAVGFRLFRAFGFQGLRVGEERGGEGRRIGEGEKLAPRVPSEGETSRGGTS